MDRIEQALTEAKRVRDRCLEVQVSNDRVIDTLSALDDERIERDQYQVRLRALKAEL